MHIIAINEKRGQEFEGEQKVVYGKVWRTGAGTWEGLEEGEQGLVYGKVWRRAGAGICKGLDGGKERGKCCN